MPKNRYTEDEESHTSTSIREQEKHRHHQNARRHHPRINRYTRTEFEDELPNPSTVRKHLGEEDDTTVVAVVHATLRADDNENEIDDEDQISCIENPCPSKYAKDCLYALTMLMNFVVILLCIIFLVNYNVIYYPENAALMNSTFWFTMVAIFVCLVCFFSDCINCCKIDIHSSIDTCPLVFWMMCNGVFLVLNLIQLTLVLAVLITVPNKCTEEKDRLHILIRLGFGKAALVTIGMCLLVIGGVFFFLRLWCFFVINSLRRVIEKKYPNTYGRHYEPKETDDSQSPIISAEFFGSDDTMSRISQKGQLSNDLDYNNSIIRRIE